MTNIKYQTLLQYKYIYISTNDLCILKLLMKMNVVTHIYNYIVTFCVMKQSPWKPSCTEELAYLFSKESLEP